MSLSTMLVPHERIVRAWFDSVFNPSLRRLDAEIRFLQDKNYSFRRLRRELSFITESRQWIDSIYFDNFQDFLDSDGGFQSLAAYHDAHVILLTQSCSDYYDHISASCEFASIINGKLAEGKYIENPKSDSLKEDIEKDRNSTLGFIAENLTNSMYSLQESYTHFDFINKYGREIKDELNSRDQISRELSNKLDEAGEKLLIGCIKLLQYLRERRAELSRAVGLPFVSTGSLQ